MATLVTDRLAPCLTDELDKLSGCKGGLKIDNCEHVSFGD